MPRLTPHYVLSQTMHSLVGVFILLFILKYFFKQCSLGAVFSFSFYSPHFLITLWLAKEETPYFPSSSIFKREPFAVLSIC